jgi:hypothetical protein
LPFVVAADVVGVVGVVVASLLLLLLLSPACHVRLALLKPPKEVLSHMTLH